MIAFVCIGVHTRARVCVCVCVYACVPFAWDTEGKN